MIQLPNNCSCSNISVHPKNWNKPGASINEDWYIQYRFYDPMFKPKYPAGKFCVVKAGLNTLKTLSERRALVKALVSDELIVLKTGYNPHTKRTHFPSPKTGKEIDPYTPLMQALHMSMDQLKVSTKDIKTTLKYIGLSAKDLGYDQMPVSRVTRKYVTFLLENCINIKAKWSPHVFNQYRSHLMMLFKKLVQLEAVDANPVTSDIPKEEVTMKVKELLTPAERLKIDEHFAKVDPNFQRFIHVFFHSGARPCELLRLKKEDVYLDKGFYKVTIRKGRRTREELRPIKLVAIPFWTDLVQSAMSGDYIFGKRLAPGPRPCLRDYITKKWSREVKIKLSISKDLYSLKHLNLDETAGLLNISDAARMAGHTSTAMTLRHYAVNEKDRQNERLRLLDNKFAG